MTSRLYRRDRRLCHLKARIRLRIDRNAIRNIFSGITPSIQMCLEATRMSTMETRWLDNSSACDIRTREAAL
jgi:hypothetical protein